jgi:hypothetical protein
MMRALRMPALHYLVLGGVLFAARSTVLEQWSDLVGPGVRPRIVITAAQRGEVQREFRERLGRLPGPEEERGHLDRLVDDEILYREALVRGLDSGNDVVRDRVVQSMRLLAEDPNAAEEVLYREGLRIGLDRRDLVVQRHLATMMRLLAVAPARAEATSDADLQEVLARGGDLFQLPATTSLTHVFVSARRGRATAAAAARHLLDELRAGRVDPADAPARGDPFPMGYRLAGRTDRDLDGLFGAGFASALAHVPPESWNGPILSSYGVHLVWVHSRVPGGLPALDSVRGRLVEHVRRERGARRLREWLAERRKGYDVTIEEPSEVAALPLRSEVSGAPSGASGPPPGSIAAPPEGRGGGGPSSSVSLPRAAVFVGD